MLNLPVIAVVGLAVLFGALSKLADLANEHGLQLSPIITLLLGLAWGLTGAILCVANPHLAILYCATVLYWFLKIKLEFPNHAWGGVLILGTGLWVASTTASFNWVWLMLIFGWLTLNGYLNSYLKARWPHHRILMKVLRWRLFYYAAGLLLTILSQDIQPLLVSTAGMIATEIVTYWGWLHVSKSRTT